MSMINLMLCMIFLVLFCDKVPPAFRTLPWWVADRGHNDIIRGHEEEYIRCVLCYVLLCVMPYLEAWQTNGLTY